MARQTLGALLRSRREQAGLTQQELARMLPGSTRGAINNIENGATKTVSADVANELVKILPVTMGELVRAMGYDLPQVHSSLPEGIISDLENAPEEVRAAVQLLLTGWRVQQQASRASEAR